MSLRLRCFWSGWLLFFSGWALASENLQPTPGQPIVELSGSWDFYWQEWLAPGDISQKPPAKVGVRQRWTEKQLPADGFATYVLRLPRLQPNADGYELEVNEPLSAALIDVFPANDPTRTVTGRVGRAMPSVEQTVSTKKAVIVHFKVEQEQDYLVQIRLTNNFYPEGGFWHIPRLGLGEAITQSNNRLHLAEYLTLGVLLIMGVWNFALVWQRREDKASLMLGFACLILAVRAFSTAYIGSEVFGFEGLWWMRTLALIEYLSMVLSPVIFILFLSASFPGIVPAVILKGEIVLAVLQTIFLLVVPTRTYMLTLPVLQLFVFVAMIIGYTNMILAVRLKMEGARLALLGSLVFGFATVNDIMVAMRVYDGIAVASYGLAFFIFSQSQISALRFAQAFRSQKTLSQQLLKAHHELIEKDKARTALFHNTSHELRTPLNGLLGFLQVLISGKPGDVSVAQQDYLRKSIALAEALHAQVNTILELSFSRKGELRLETTRIQLHEFETMIRTVSQGLKDRYPGTDFRFRLQFSQSNPEFHQDGPKLLMIVRHLLDNAFKFRQPGRPQEVSCLLDRGPGQLLIEIRDNGIGIAKDQQTRIFEDFAQVEADARRRYEGSGVGLSLVRDLVQLMQGTLEVESDLGRGALFRIRIPEQSAAALPVLSPKKPAASAPVEVLPSRTAEPAPVRVVGLNPADFRLLVIDDNTTNIEVLKELLEIDGFRVDGFESPQQGLEHMRTDPPDLLLLDLMMPEISGEDVIKEMKQDPQMKDIPIIFITARASAEDKVLGLDLGADDYMPKPFSAEELSLRIRNLLIRVESSRRLGEESYQEKMQQLGELTSEVSHELKNLFQGLELENQTAVDHYRNVLALLPLDESVRADLQNLPFDGLLNGQNTEPLEPPSRQHPHYGILRQLRMILGQWPLTRELRDRIWAGAQAAESEPINQLVHLLALIQSHQILLHTANRSQAITLAILDVNRKHVGDRCSVLEAIHDVIPLLAVRLRKKNVKLDCHTEPQQILMAKGIFQQIALNLIANAVDALAPLPADQRWIRIKWVKTEKSIDIRFINGGPRIPDHVARRMFHRGFSTKGQKGTGIGLHLSARLATESRCQLRFDANAIETTFVLSIPLVIDASLAA